LRKRRGKIKPEGGGAAECPQNRDGTEVAWSDQERTGGVAAALGAPTKNDGSIEKVEKKKPEDRLTCETF